MFPKILGIDAYLIMALIGFAAGFGLGWIRRKKYGYTPSDLVLMFCSIVIGLIIGARLLFTVTSLPTLINHKFAWDVVKDKVVDAGFVFYGGVLGSLLALYIMAKKTKMNVRQVLNFAIPCFTCFHMFGRIGCLLQGCCYGIESEHGFVTVAGETVKRIPVQLFEAIGLLLITVILLLLEAENIKKNKSIALVPVYFALYAPFRFALEMLRGDALRGILRINGSYDTEYAGNIESVSYSFSISTSQIISVIIVVVLAVYVWYSLMITRREKKAEKAAEEAKKTEEATEITETSETEA